ncbi:MAG: DEAD/DEAH box helicase [Flavobacteriales bacterium]|nr:DEAD/DEAH box helicase [Flavobacteriales bacterium]
MWRLTTSWRLLRCDRLEQQSHAFHLLDERIQRFIWEAGWTDLRDAQERAIPAIVSGTNDVIIAAATAEGKTEAAFYPALTHALAQLELPLIMYIGPLKALINDQFQRLALLCERLDIPVHPWHGDIGGTIKTRFLKRPEGVLLITPESLEATLCNRGSSVGLIFQRASFFIIDELHAFIGTERGMQLRSQLHRIEAVVGRQVPRIGLSATLGDMNAAGHYLRPLTKTPVQLIVSEGTGRELKVLIKGYEEPLVKQIAEDESEEPVSEIGPGLIAEHMYDVLRGSNNLVFPNSRKNVELYTHRLSRMCEERGVPNEFWPHHGSLSKEIRTEAEAALKSGEVPATGVCTNTLELGIDIGSVKCVVQVGCPPSVASLRQRLGRSGRRKGESAILRGYLVEDEIGPSSPVHTQLRQRTFQTTAMVSLLADKWFEPPSANGKHFSTFIQQLLSFIAQNGGATASQCYYLFCSAGAPFAGIAPKEFTDLLRHLGNKKLVIQDSAGLLLHGSTGEKIVNHYSFYAAFATDEEYRIIAGQKVLGSIPISMMLVPGQFILFAGRTWRIEAVDDDARAIHVTHAGGGVPPPFDSGTGKVHSAVRQRMRLLYDGNAPVDFLDTTANKHISQGRAAYARMELSDRCWTEHGSELIIWTWLGDDVNEALATFFRYGTLQAQADGPCVSILKGALSTNSVLDILNRLKETGPPSIDDLLVDAKALRREKWDWALPDHLLRASYASLNLDLPAAIDWLRCHEFST